MATNQSHLEKAYVEYCVRIDNRVQFFSALDTKKQLFNQVGRKAHIHDHEGTNENAEGIFIRERYITSLSSSSYRKAKETLKCRIITPCNW